MEQVQLSYELDMEKESIWLNATPSPAIRASLPYIQEIGDFISHEKYYTRRSGLASYLIKYTLSGEGVLEYDGATYTVQPGQIFWIDCLKPQYYYTSPKTKAWRVIWMHFYGPTTKAYYDLFHAQNQGANTLTLPPDNNVASGIRELASLYHSAGSMLADVRAAGMLTNIMSECCGATFSGQSFLGLPESVQEARAYLVDNYSGRITLDDLARRYSINKFHFQKLFKKHTGFTPNEYLILTRLNNAKEFLRTTDMSIAAVSERVGVENVSHFINLFKKHEGITPSLYRHRWYR